MGSEGCPEPSLSVVKTLFARSGNTCAFFDQEGREPPCEQPLTDPKWKRAMARICHIAGRRPGSARWDSTLTCEQINSFDNLILLCPTHHVKVDDTEPHRFPVESLLGMKARHELRSESSRKWATDVDLEIYVELSLGQMRPIWRAADQEEAGQGLPEVSFRHIAGGELRALNRGPGIAILREAMVMAGNPAAVTLAEDVAGQLDVDESKVVGRFDPIGLDEGETVIRLIWSDALGHKTRSKNLHIERPLSS